jgi:hypothetical protein
VSAAPAPPDGISVAAHPRTARAVARAKAWGGLAGLTLVAVLALRAGLPAFDAMLRALAGGVTGYVATWAIAVAVARQLVIAEVRARHAALRRAAEAAAAPAAADRA